MENLKHGPCGDTWDAEMLPPWNAIESLKDLSYVLLAILINIPSKTFIV